MRDRTGRELVLAARGGDGRALDRLVAAYLPLVYNVVGRAQDGHADVDDVVQESYVERYAWFGLPSTPDSGTGLYTAGGALTAAGKAYRAAG